MGVAGAGAEDEAVVVAEEPATSVVQVIDLSAVATEEVEPAKTVVQLVESSAAVEEEVETQRTASPRR